MTIIGFDVSKKELVRVRTDKSTLVRDKIIINNNLVRKTISGKQGR